MEFRWDPLKSDKLKKERGVSFEEILRLRFLGVQVHPNRAHQVVLLFEIEGYVWVVPAVAQGRELFLKTLFPSRKYTKIWKRGGLR